MINMDRIGKLLDYRGKPEPRWYNTFGVKAQRGIGKIQRGLDKYINNLYDKNTPSGGLPRPPEYDQFRQAMEAKKLQNSMPQSHYNNRITEEQREINALKEPYNVF